MSTRFKITLIAALSCASAAYAFTALDATDAGWDPLVVLWGKGEKSDAVRELHRLTDAFEISLKHTKLDQATDEFVDATIEDLADFNLGDFYERLPNKNGDYRELWVRGEIKGNQYLITQAKEKKGYQVTIRGDRNELAQMSTTVRSKETRGAGDKSAYFIGYRFGLGIGDFRWDAAMTALQDYARVGTIVNPAQGAREPIVAGSSARSKAKELHPKLSNEDLDVLGVMFEAYPALAPVLSRMGTVDDVRTVWSGKSYQQVSVTLRGVPERFEKHYPALAAYMDHMDDIALLDIKWNDKKGRQLTSIKVDSEKLTFQFSCYIKDGLLLPFKGVKVYENEPIDPMADTITSTRILADARLKMLGVVIKLTGLSMDAFYEPHPGYAEMGLTFTKLPEIKVEGAALGFVPTALVDAFIPGNIESVTRDFLRVAAEGNGGKGLIAVAKLGAGKEGSNRGVLEAGIDFDALDNFLVKIGLGMVNERLIPKPDALDEAQAFIGHAHEAFVKDLTRFEKRSGSAEN
jgi:hypothetical protein